MDYLLGKIDENYLKCKITTNQLTPNHNKNHKIL